MHKATSSIVLLFPYKELVTEKTFQEYTKLANLDVAFANADSIHEQLISNADITKNTAILGGRNCQLVKLANFSYFFFKFNYN